MERRSFLSLGFMAGVGSNKKDQDPGRAERIDLYKLKFCNEFVNNKFMTFETWIKMDNLFHSHRNRWTDINGNEI